MSKILIILFLIVCNASFAQIIRGTVLDSESKEPIENAVVYVNGTSVGSYSNRQGYFELDVAKVYPLPITFSALGFISKSLPNYETDNPMIIYLAPKIFELNEVVIKGNSKSRNFYLKTFKNAFLGNTFNAARCKIENEYDIVFSYDDNGTLKAFANKPILIKNSVLGYNIIYYLDKFIYHKESEHMILHGTIIFKEFEDLRKSEKSKYLRRRNSAYMGSRMHFIRELWNNNLEESGFTTKSVINRKSIDTISLYQSDNLKFIVGKGTIFISYYSKIPDTWVYVLKELVIIDKTGFFDPSGLSWQGEMARQRVGDMLPYDY